MMLDALGQDLRQAIRSLRRSKAFTITAVSTLALGVTATTVMFALIHGVLLRPLPVDQQDRIIIAWKELRTSGSARYPFGDAEIESLRRASTLLENAAGVTRNGVGRVVIVQDGVSKYANVALVTGGFFDVLGVRPVLGRTLEHADDREGAERVVVISSGFWERHYGRTHDILGRRLTISELPFTIVGVVPPDLDYPAGVEVWRPTGSVSTSEPFGDAARREVNLVARLRPSVTIEQATDEITALNARLDESAPPGAVRGLTPVVRPLIDVFTGDIRRPMLALFVAVGFVLLIASANVANLLLSQGEARRAESAVRAALGAGRSRLVRQVMAESAIISILAGGAGLVAASWSLQAVLTVLPEGLPRLESIRIDVSVVAFSLGALFVAALLAGLAPGWFSVPEDLAAALRTGGRGGTGAVALSRRILVITQVALAVTVVAAAGLLVRSALRLQSVDLGLPAEQLVLVDLHLPQALYGERHEHARLLDQLIEHLESVPTIAAATPVNVPPFTGRGWDLPRFTAEGQSEQAAALNPSVNLESVHPNYFETFEVAVLRGRAFTAADREGAMHVAIVSEDMAARSWPGADAVGKRLKMGGSNSASPWYTVVGVAAKTRYREVTGPRPTLYLPAAQFQMTATTIVLRTTASNALTASLSRELIGAVAPAVRVIRVAPFREMLHRPLARPRFHAFLLGMFGIVALLLSAVGLHGLLTAFVRQRDREIAVRMALGADRGALRRLVLSETMRLAGFGALIGLAGATLGSRMLRGMLFEIDPLDPFAMSGAAVLLIGVSALASYPAIRRATRIDAIAALRS